MVATSILISSFARLWYNAACVTLQGGLQQQHTPWVDDRGHVNFGVIGRSCKRRKDTAVKTAVDHILRVLRCTSEEEQIQVRVSRAAVAKGETAGVRQSVQHVHAERAPCLMASPHQPPPYTRTRCCRRW